MKRLLVIDDDPRFCADIELRTHLACQVTRAATPAAASHLASRETFDGILIDVESCAPADGMVVLRSIRRRAPHTPVILLTDTNDRTTAQDTDWAGASDIISKSAAREALSGKLTRALEARHAFPPTAMRAVPPPQTDAYSSLGWIGDSKLARHVRELIETFAPTESPVLITGPTGVGKDLVARLIHRRSRRSNDPFVAVNCAAVPAALADSTFFGHAKGAFTGATSRRQGCFELADSGTLFLDEFVEMGSELQAKLLRVLEGGEIQRVGSERIEHVDVRIITATNCDIDVALATGKLREDVYYRLSLLTITVPPLRERPLDILPLAHHFVRRRAASEGKEAIALTAASEAMLMSYAWPGNVRELRNVVERAVVLTRGTTIEPRHLTGLRDSLELASLPFSSAREMAARDFEREYLSAILMMSHGCVTEAAERIGISRQGLHKNLRKYGIDPSAFRQAAS